MPNRDQRRRDGTFEYAQLDLAPASDEPARCRGIDPAYPGQRCEQARYHEGPCFEGPCPPAQCAYQFTDGTMCRCDLGRGHAGMHHCPCLGPAASGTPDGGQR